MRIKYTWKLISINPITAEVFRDAVSVGRVVRVQGTCGRPLDYFELIHDKGRQEFNDHRAALDAACR